jgi:hypothetical protein
MHARRVAQLTRRRAGSVTPYDDVALASLASADVGHAKEFGATELGRLAADDDHSRRLTATLRVYLEENMSPLRAAQRLGVHENTITNRIRTAQELLPHRSSTARPSCRSRSDCSAGAGGLFPRKGEQIDRIAKMTAPNTTTQRMVQRGSPCASRQSGSETEKVSQTVSARYAKAP